MKKLSLSLILIMFVGYTTKQPSFPSTINIGLNVVYTPEQYDFRHLPHPVKNVLIEKFSQTTGKIKMKLDPIINLLKNNIPGCNVYFPKFWYELKALDKIRNESFGEVMPEYFNAITTAESWLLDIK